MAATRLTCVHTHAVATHLYVYTRGKYGYTHGSAAAAAEHIIYTYVHMYIHMCGRWRKTRVSSIYAHRPLLKCIRLF